jgi:hypothetical protein
LIPDRQNKKSEESAESTSENAETNASFIFEFYRLRPAHSGQAAALYTRFLRKNPVRVEPALASGFSHAAVPFIVACFLGLYLLLLLYRSSSINLYALLSNDPLINLGVALRHKLYREMLFDVSAHRFAVK